MIYREIELKISEKCTGERSEVVPKLQVYIPTNSAEIDLEKKRKTILICPGGGYEMTSDREAEPVALKLIAEGYNACVLRYSVAPATFPTALCEAATAMALIREHEEEWNVDKIVVAGFSAGGHLAASLATMWHTEFLEEQSGLRKEQYQPQGVLLAYPVITAGEHAHQGSFTNLLNGTGIDRETVSLENCVTEHMPPAFIWHTYDDIVVPVENSFLLATQMRRQNIPLELHIFPEGRHGLSLANEITARKLEPDLINEACQSWLPLFLEWMKNI